MGLGQTILSENVYFIYHPCPINMLKKKSAQFWNFRKLLERNIPTGRCGKQDDAIFLDTKENFKKNEISRNSYFYCYKYSNNGK